MNLLEGMIDRCDIVGDVLYVVDVRGSGLLSLLPGQHVDQSRLGAFDLRGQQGLLAHEGIDEPFERRDHLAGQVESRQRRFSVAQWFGQRCQPLGAESGWERIGDEGLDRLSGNGGGDVTTCRLRVHGKEYFTKRINK